MQTLILGTAQWGSAYGVTNQVGRLDDRGLAELVVTARERGITGLDTAPGYGDAEERIARWGDGFAIATKVIGAGTASVIDQIKDSLARLGRSRVERCLVHDWPTLLREQRAATVRALGEARDLGLIAAAGVSGYTADDLTAALEFDGILSIAQVPANVLDQRLDDSGPVRELRELGWTLQARSVFLQGVLAAPSQGRFGRHPATLAVASEASLRGIRMIDLAASYVASRNWIDEVVVGVTSAAELVDVASALSAKARVDESALRGLASDDADLIDPRRWNR